LPVATLAVLRCLKNIEIQALQSGVNATFGIVYRRGEPRHGRDVFADRVRHRQVHGTVCRQNRPCHAGVGKQDDATYLPHQNLETANLLRQLWHGKW
jgi:hypothetical protein